MPAKKNNLLSYLWLWPIIYFALGFFNILFAWLGMLDVMLPVLFALIGGNKFFCNHMCGRGMLFTVITKKFKISSGKPAPKFFSSKYFRYGFLIFFMAMFTSILIQTYFVYSGTANLKEFIKILWAFNIPFSLNLSMPSQIPAWIIQFSYGFYSLMLSSTIIGLIVMALYRPRTWCTFCPMGSMTQAICKIKNHQPL